MTKPKMIIIATVAPNRVIENNGRALWLEDDCDPRFREDIREDRRRFNKTTMGFPVVMDDKTYDLIVDSSGVPLEGRENIVVSKRDPFLTQPARNGLHSIQNLGTALGYAANLRCDRTFNVTGGEYLCRQTIGKARRLVITHINRYYSGSAFFPEIDMNVWKRTESDPRDGFRFDIYERKRAV
jgi:dihydrofolate reductase